MESDRRGGSPGVEDRAVLVRGGGDARACRSGSSHGPCGGTRGPCSRSGDRGVVLAVSGSPLPSVWPVLLLGAILALSINQFAFFPSEWSATAEVAVLVAAVVGFADSAEFLGPVAVALLCGPLDSMHWRHRAFWRMAYNAGSRMIGSTARGGGVPHGVHR